MVKRSHHYDNHTLSKITTDIWLLLEEKILPIQIIELEHSDDYSFAAFDCAKWVKHVKIKGWGNEKSLAFLTSCIRDIGELWPNAKIDVIPLDQVLFLSCNIRPYLNSTVKIRKWVLRTGRSYEDVRGTKANVKIFVWFPHWGSLNMILYIFSYFLVISVYEI